MAKQVKDVYGNALFELAIEEDRIDEYMQEAGAVSIALNENPGLYDIMMHPRISDEEKSEVLSNVFKERVSDEMYALLDMLLSKGHFGDTGDVLSVFIDRVKAFRRIGVVRISTPMELSASKKDSIKKRLLETTDFVSLEMHYSIDPSLIGGMIIKIGDRLVDSSIKTRLERLSHELSAGTIA